MTRRVSQSIRRLKAGADPETSLYDRIGAANVERLVVAFYAHVDTDPVIRPLYGKTLSCAIRDAWLANMRAAVREVGIPDAEAALLMAHLEFGARALVNTGEPPMTKHGPGGFDRFDERLAEKWNLMAEAETLFDAVSRGDLALVRSMLPLRLVPHAVLMSHALSEWLDPTGRKDRRCGRRPRHVKPLDVIECLLAHRAFDVDPVGGDDLGRFRHLQALVEAYTGVSRMISRDSPFHSNLRAATRDRFMAEVERDHSIVRLLGPRGQTLLHDAAIVGEAELAEVLIRSGANPDAKEAEGHTPLYRASTGDVARVLLAAGATADVESGPTRGTALHQASRHGYVSVVQALLQHGASIDPLDAKGQTPLRRAVNCRRLQIVRLLVRHGADPNLADRRGVTPLDAAHTDELKHALADAGG